MTPPRSSLPSWWVLIITGVLVTTVSCTKRNPNVCCTTQADCEASGLSKPTPCTQDGLVCIRNVCDTPNDCQADSDCSAPLVCNASDGSCVECVDSSTCGNEVCDEATHSCRNCISDDECGRGFCGTATNVCHYGIVPRYVPHACDEASTRGELTIDVDTTLNLDDLSNCTGAIVAQPNGPAICVVHYTAITVSSNATLTVGGANALALVADDDVSIDGTLDLDADIASSGPGGGSIVSGGAPAELIGGGGAGFDTDGGAGGLGGVSGQDGGANNAGARTVDSSPAALVGGRRAGGPGGGGGGGAATIVACRGTASVTGVLSSVGGGGDRGDVALGGFGGGSGGYLALQGHVVSITGRAFANGGGGGRGGAGGFFPTVGEPGVNGLRSMTCELPGFPDSGSSGGCVASAPGIGTSAIVLGYQARQPGGGGGSVGFLATFTPDGIDADIRPSEASPGFRALTLPPQ